ncbi:MAG: hypothetical protein JOZ82_04440 [Marmoricola sp.]|nr:hypothetical protein [Marmoricola sp.]
MQNTDYIAVVEVATRVETVRPEAAASLREYEPVFGRSPRGWVEIRLKVSASGLAHACATAAAMARVASGAEGLACQVMTQVEYDARRFATNGRHAATVESAPVLPRQPTDSERDWKRAAVES